MVPTTLNTVNMDFYGNLPEAPKRHDNFFYIKNLRPTCGLEPQKKSFCIYGVSVLKKIFSENLSLEVEMRH